MSNIVIVGDGPAAVWAAISAQKTAPSAKIVIVSEENVEPYEKPALSKGILLGTTNHEQIRIAGIEGVAARGIELRFGHCMGINRSTATIEIQRQQPLHYDALVIATGARCRQLPIFRGHIPKCII